MAGLLKKKGLECEKLCASFGGDSPEGVEVALNEPIKEVRNIGLSMEGKRKLKTIIQKTKVSFQIEARMWGTRNNNAHENKF